MIRASRARATNRRRKRILRLQKSYPSFGASVKISVSKKEPQRCFVEVLDESASPLTTGVLRDGPFRDVGFEADRLERCGAHALRKRCDRHARGRVSQAGNQALCLLLATGLAFRGLFSARTDRAAHRAAGFRELGCLSELHGWTVARIADEVWRNRRRVV